MQKLIFFISITLFSTVYSQFERFETGIETGAAFGTFWGSNIPSTFYQSRVSYSSGTFFRYNFIPNTGIQTGLYFEKISTRDDVLFTNGDNKIMGKGELFVNADYVTIPLMAKYSVGNKLRASFSFGSFFSYLVNYDLLIRYDETLPNTDLKYDYTTKMNRFNTGVVLGAGLDYIILKKMKLGFECRDQLGLSTISRSGPDPGDNFFATNSFQVLARISYMFN